MTIRIGYEVVDDWQAWGHQHWLATLDEDQAVTITPEMLAQMSDGKQLAIGIAREFGLGVVLDPHTIDELRQLRAIVAELAETKKLDEFRGERGDYNDYNAIAINGLRRRAKEFINGSTEPFYDE